MRSLPEGWAATRHAVQRMIDKGVSPDEVLAAVEHPQVRHPDPKGRAGCASWWHGEVGIVVDERQKTIITVLINGAARDDWQAHAQVREQQRQTQQERRRQTLSTAMKKLAPTPQPERAARPAQRRTAPPRAIPANVHPGIYKIALKRAHGDTSRIRVLGPTRVEVLPVAS